MPNPVAFHETTAQAEYRTKAVLASDMQDDPKHENSRVTLPPCVGATGALLDLLCALRVDCAELLCPCDTFGFVLHGTGRLRGKKIKFTTALEDHHRKEVIRNT